MNPLKKTFHENAVLLVLILGLITFILYIYFFVNPSQVIRILFKTNLSVYAGAFLAYLLYTLCASLVWQRLLNNLSVKITKRKAFLFTWVGLFFEATVPQLGWSGDVSKTYLLAKDSNVSVGKIGASVVGQKIFTMTLTIMALSTGLGLVLLKYSLPTAATLLIGLVLALSILTLG
ncbi:MAG TPA: lysylphosphatidylglycerol synthase transmembrane domain-containing protein, partial [Candidatus Bathyarchaeia archaeon]